MCRLWWHGIEWVMEHQVRLKAELDVVFKEVWPLTAMNVGPADSDNIRQQINNKWQQNSVFDNIWQQKEVDYGKYLQKG